MSEETLDERALVDRCRKGDDESAFGELVDRYKNLVYGMVWRMAPDRGQVDDLAQEVFLKVHRGLPYFRGEARLSTWIYRIVMNVCREARGRPRVEVPMTGRDGETVVEPASQDRAFAGIEVRDRVEKALAQLPEPYRMIIAAHHLKGIQYEALAEALNMPLGTVKTHLHRAKRRLREILEQQG